MSISANIIHFVKIRITCRKEDCIKDDCCCKVLYLYVTMTERNIIFGSISSSRKADLQGGVLAGPVAQKNCFTPILRHLQGLSPEFFQILKIFTNVFHFKGGKIFQKGPIYPRKFLAPIGAQGVTMSVRLCGTSLSRAVDLHLSRSESNQRAIN